MATNIQLCGTISLDEVDMSKVSTYALLIIGGFLGSCTMQCGGCIPLVLRSILPPSSWFKCTSTLKMEATWSSKMLVSNHHTTWHNNLENNEYLHCHENLKSCIICYLPDNTPVLPSTIKATIYY